VSELSERRKEGRGDVGLELEVELEMDRMGDVDCR